MATTDINIDGQTLAAALPSIGTSGLPGTGPASLPALPVDKSVLGTIQQGINSLIPDALNPAVKSSPNTIGSAIGGLTSNASTWVTNLFLRGVIIVLGFIFVAIGLHMFSLKETNVVVYAGRNNKRGKKNVS